AFFAVVFIQSALDKLVDRDGNIAFFSDHFKNSPLPTAAVPQFPEQETNAARVRDLGLGRWLDAAELDPGSLRAAVEDVAEDADVRANLAWMRQVIAESGGAAAAADIVESRL
ncbi:MAG: hypothetical protein IJH84_22605, partial [Saccharopolyspora sp.]|nr:hypothetical protein [Saccharopolyspora sp.]